MEKKNYRLGFVFWGICLIIVFYLSVVLTFNIIERIIINLLLMVFWGLLVYTPLSLSLKEWYYMKKDYEEAEKNIKNKLEVNKNA